MNIRVSDYMKRYLNQSLQSLFYSKIAGMTFNNMSCTNKTW